MRLLDTGVLSELIRPTSDPRVQRWADRLPHHAFCTAATVAAELRFGVELLPAGLRRRHASHAVDRLLRNVLGRRILPFDLTSARHCAVFRAARQQAGRPVSLQAAMIVATAVAHRVEAIVTRDLDGFESCGLLLVDPWAA